MQAKTWWQVRAVGYHVFESLNGLMNALYAMRLDDILTNDDLMIFYLYTYHTIFVKCTYYYILVIFFLFSSFIS